MKHIPKLVTFASMFAWSCVRVNAADPSALNRFLAQIQKEQPSVQWDATSTQTGDFGDGLKDLVLLGRKGNAVILAIGHTLSRSAFSAQYLEFAIDRKSQAAICTLPTRLEVHPLQCADNGGGVLPGCKERPRAIGLRLVDDECDPINMYWNHDAKRMVWWRN